MNEASSQGWITFPSLQGEIRAFTATPRTAPPWLALIVVQGANGLDEHHQSLTLEFAEQGYYAVSPDLYTHDPHYRSFGPRVVADGVVLGMLLRGQIAAHQIPGMRQDGDPKDAYLARYEPQRAAEVARARDWIHARPGEEVYVSIVQACFDFLRGRSDVSRIGAIGYCMGGRFVGELAASRPALAAAVIYYGMSPKLDRVAHIRCPIQGHYGVTDRMITDGVPRFAEAMKAAGKNFSYFVYDAGHAFALPPPYASHDAEATKLAAERTRAFLAAQLR